MEGIIAIASSKSRSELNKQKNNSYQHQQNSVIINKNFKEIKKLDLKRIAQNKNESKSSMNVQMKSDERGISKDWEHYMEFISKEDENAEKILNIKVPYLFWTINDKESLSSTNKEIAQKYTQNQEKFYSRLEKKFENSTMSSNISTNTSNSINLNWGNLNFTSPLYRRNKVCKYN